MEIKKYFPNKPMPDMSRPLYLIIPAAGLGLRMGISDSKQFLDIGGMPVLARTLQAFSDFQKSRRIPLHAVIVTNADNIDRTCELVEKYHFEFVELIVEGGATRQDSVGCGLAALSELPSPPSDMDPVFVHDGARCMVDQKTLQKCYTGGILYDVSVAATPCKNTVKLAQQVSEALAAAQSEDSPLLVDKTLPRDLLYEVQTPQVFRYRSLLKVHEYARMSGIQATDDTALAEACGLPVRLLPCSYGNIKITTPEDVVMAELMLKNRENK